LVVGKVKAWRAQEVDRLRAEMLHDTKGQDAGVLTVQDKRDLLGKAGVALAPSDDQKLAYMLQTQFTGSVSMADLADPAKQQQALDTLRSEAVDAFDALVSNGASRLSTLLQQDVDHLWDARKRVQFASTMAKLDSSLLKLLQRADPSFRRMEGQIESAINDKGFMVDFLRRMATEGDPHPFRFTEDEGDLWPVQAQRAEDFLHAPRYERVVFSVTGRMALMRTVSPAVFVAFKRWMAELDNRPAGKRRRDKLQADIVQQMLDEKALQPE
jgi:Nucleotidyltransferase